ncbi:TonB-dependent receptor [Sphingobium boeckii]|uniref:Iron complex outermembrane receptor protein n=1 Tax=Sphingobium boeckii TaxID=1082345 RepID=A0A7W9AKZ4_9SPHN|nr:TonB-dependent receptor [Sphingobium boeckii]MBB5687406.1 iron complex outermembrane receptor protein [Sphingobium boeckii]
MAILLAGASAPAVAQSDHAADAGTDKTVLPAHDDNPVEIVVTAMHRSREDLLGGTSVLSAGDLDAARRSNLGDTLASLPGVSATSFGPVASRPVLRGLQADRIRVLIDGIGSFDASGSSVDHAVAINPLTAERIEVLRGPTALLYGSSAIGGVVSVIDGRIPRSVPANGIRLKADADYGSAAEERRGAASADVALGGGFVIHADGSYTKTDDLRTGGYLLSKPLRAEAAASPIAEIQELADLKGKLPNTPSESHEVALGAAYIGDGGNIGFSVSRLDNRYGVPIRFSLDPDVEAEAPTLDVKQYRADLRAEITPASGFLDAIRFRAGYGDYRHFEIEDTGEIATTFLNKGMEGRLEFSQRQKGAWSGAFGAQYLTRDFKVIGEEAFLPPTSTEQGGLFTVQNFDFGHFRAEAGARYEHTNVIATASDALGTPDAERSFSTFTGSLGGLLEFAPNVKFGLNLTHTERAPTAEELFANGPHLATQAFEVGNPLFGKEKSNGAEVLLRGRGLEYSFEISAYYNDFTNFIYQSPTGDEEDGLPVYGFAAAGAKQYGFEAEANITLAHIGDAAIVADGLIDYVRVKIEGQGSAPFIPPLRVLGGLEYQSGGLVVRGEVEHATKQDKVAAFETTTPGFTLANARIEWKPMGKGGLLSLRLAANNIFDVEARRHASFLADYAPLAGRDIRVGASVRF